MKANRLLALLTGVAVLALAHAQSALPTMEVGGKFFHYTQVNDKETVHGVSQRTGIAIDDIIAANPSANDGLNRNQLLLFPVTPVNSQVSAPASIAVNNTSVQMYTMGEGENLYTVAKKFNSSVEGLLGNNLNLTPQQFVPGTTIKVAPNSAMPFYYDATDIKFVNHTVQNKETMASIASLYGTDELTLARLNPSVDKLKKNKPIVVPRYTRMRVLGNMTTADVKDVEAYYAPRVDDIHNKLVEEMRNSVCNVGIILPFQLNNDNAPRQAYLYTDFLKGFMIALDSLGSNSMRKVNIKVYDTEHNLDVTNNLLAQDELKHLNFIIAPGEPKQLELINEFGKANGIQVLNAFSTKNEDYTTNAYSLVVNTPTPNLVKNVTQWVETRFTDCSVVYLQDENSDESEMFKLLKTNFATMGIESETVKVGNTLTADALSRVLNPGTNYLFVPSNGGKALLGRIKAALKTVKETRVDCGINLLGYPEYTLYLKDNQEDLMAIDTYMFSRFFNTKGFRTRNVEDSYRKRYGEGEEMLESYPTMGIYGFDAGVFVINTLGAGEDIDNATQLQKGIQTGFKFRKVDGCEGLVNQAVTLVHFSPDKKIESFVTTGR